jgi:uncharacterized SAM-binding protein YcdF (DUF218 family)
MLLAVPMQWKIMGDITRGFSWGGGASIVASVLGDWWRRRHCLKGAVALSTLKLHVFGSLRTDT